MRDTAYWPKNFLAEVESYRVEQGIALWSLGGPSFLYQSPRTSIYIDPYFGPTPPEAEVLSPGVYRATAIPIYAPEIRRADAVISTHDHIDHCHETTLLALQSNTAAQFLGPETSTQRMLKGGIARGRIRTVTPGDEFKIKDVAIKVFDSHDPDAPGAVTYVLVAELVTLFASGDSRDGPTLDQIGNECRVDIALLAFGGPRWYMTHDKMLAAAQRLRPKVLLPFHWELWRGERGDPVALGKAIAVNPLPFDVRLLQIGDRIHYWAGRGIVTG
jgi:L-ascorbate 6-phosphate lactonase